MGFCLHRRERVGPYYTALVARPVARHGAADVVVTPLGDRGQLQATWKGLLAGDAIQRAIGSGISRICAWQRRQAPADRALRPLRKG